MRDFPFVHYIVENFPNLVDINTQNALGDTVLMEIAAGITHMLPTMSPVETNIATSAPITSCTSGDMKLLDFLMHAYADDLKLHILNFSGQTLLTKAWNANRFVVAHYLINKYSQQ